MANFYITTPIFYVNDVPHIGHAYTSIACDVIARFMRLQGLDVKYLSGTDEHGQKVEKSAIKSGMRPEEFVNKNSKIFKDMMSVLNISNDDFIRTTDNKHKISAIEFWKKLENSGNIYLSKYSGWYSVRDEAYYSEDELTPDGLAPTGAPVEWVEEPSYFFALSKWEDKLLEHYENNPDFIKPESRFREVMGFIKNGLHDLSISRTSFKWGIKVPGDESHVFYVWLDALTNYISALGYPEKSEEFSKFWPASAHVVGKDILIFHAVYWPAFLMAADIKLPKTIMAHGWWTNEGQKISKSVGNVIDPFSLVEEFGLDQVRYFLMREINFGNDGNFSKNNLKIRSNSELCNKIGNLLQRTSSLAYKYCDESIPEVSQSYIDSLYKTDLYKEIISMVEDNFLQIKSFHINKVLENILCIADKANSYIDHEAPWSLKLSDTKKMNEVLYTVIEMIRYIAIMLQPFIPDSANIMLDQLRISKKNRYFKNLNKAFAIKSGEKISKPVIVFPRID